MMPAVIPDITDEEDYCATSASTSQTRFFQGFPSETSNNEVMSLRRDREREGRCAECGIQTHTFRNDDFLNNQVKVPLTVKGEVHRGRCLLCHPIATPELVISQQRSPNYGTTFPYQSTGIFSAPAMESTTISNNSFSDSMTQREEVRVREAAVAAILGRKGNSHEVFNEASKCQQVQEALSLLERCTADIVDILSTMRRFPYDQLVQERGSERLWVQSWEDENSAAIGRVGGIPIILEAMARFPTSTHLQQCACETLQNLALNAYNRSEICDHGGVSLIVQAMMRNIDVASIQQCGCVAIASLAASKDLHRDIIHSGGAHAVINAARRFHDQENVQLGAQQALQTLDHHDPAWHAFLLSNSVYKVGCTLAIER